MLLNLLQQPAGTPTSSVRNISFLARELPVQLVRLAAQRQPPESAGQNLRLISSLRPQLFREVVSSLCIGRNAEGFYFNLALGAHSCRKP